MPSLWLYGMWWCTAGIIHCEPSSYTRVEIILHPLVSPHNLPHTSTSIPLSSFSALIVDALRHTIDRDCTGRAQTHTYIHNTIIQERRLSARTRHGCMHACMATYIHIHTCTEYVRLVHTYTYLGPRQRVTRGLLKARGSHRRQPPSQYHYVPPSLFFFFHPLARNVTPSRFSIRITTFFFFSPSFSAGAFFCVVLVSHPSRTFILLFLAFVLLEIIW